MKEDEVLMEVTILAAATNPEYIEKAKATLTSLLSKHLDKDLTLMEGLTIRALFEIGVAEVEKARKKLQQRASS